MNIHSMIFFSSNAILTMLFKTFSVSLHLLYLIARFMNNHSVLCPSCEKPVYLFTGFYHTLEYGNFFVYVCVHVYTQILSKKNK